MNHFIIRYLLPDGGWRRGILPLLMTVACLLGCVGCGAPSMKHLVHQSDPLRAGSDYQEPVSFKGVIVNISPGQTFGAHYGGIFQVKKFDRIWNSSATYGTGEFRVRASDMMRSLGYNVLGGRPSLFEEDDGPKATYQIGATITDIKLNTFGVLAGNYQEAVVQIEWQLYNALRREVIYVASTKGYAKTKSVGVDGIFPAFDNALENLLAEPVFRNHLKEREKQRPQQHASGFAWDTVAVEQMQDSPTHQAPSGSAPGDPEGPPAEGAPGNPSRLTITVAPPATLALPDRLEEALESTVMVRVGSTLGAGVVISPDGYVITAAHVVRSVESAELVFKKGLALTADVIARDDHQDLALLKLPGGGFSCLSMVEHGSTVPGTPVFGVGTPYSEDFAFSVTQGVISGHRILEDFIYLQTDAALSPGYSGGPLLNRDGQIVAIISWKIVRADTEGMAFCVPVQLLEERLGVTFEQPAE
ncbi:trypsin-like serine protease [candidate division GN15 bacterium]|nr:trypsin-like serine protease [candidate division GN15 bacterium]